MSQEQTNMNVYEEEPVLKIRMPCKKCNDIVLDPVEVKRIQEYAQSVNKCIGTLYDSGIPNQPGLLLKIMR